MGLGFGCTSTSCSAPSLAETCAGTEQRSGVNVWESMCADMCDYVLPLHSIHSKTSNLYIFPLMCCFVLCQVMLLLGHT